MKAGIRGGSLLGDGRSPLGGSGGGADGLVC